MELSDEKLDVFRAQKNPEHFAVLYQRYYETILRFIQSKISSREISEDLASQTFVKALENIAYFRWQGISFRSWIFRIARNTMYDYFRSSVVRKSRRLSETFEDTLAGSVSLERELLYDEDELKLFETIASFPPKDQYLLYYKYFEGMSVEEISQIVGLSKANVATRLHRIRKVMESKMSKGSKK